MRFLPGLILLALLIFGYAEFFLGSAASDSATPPVALVQREESPEAAASFSALDLPESALN